jgi:hypothetical protein
MSTASMAMTNENNLIGSSPVVLKGAVTDRHSEINYADEWPEYIDANQQRFVR